MGDAVPMEWILDVERQAAFNQKQHLGRLQEESPEFYHMVVKHNRGREPTSMEQYNIIMSPSFKKEWTELQESKIKKTQKFAFTFTTNAHCDDWLAAEQDMIKACHKLYSQTSCEIMEGACYLEYTKDGRPHVHGWYQTHTGGRVYAKVFERIWKIWDESKKQGKGHQGGFHERVKSLQYERYASAEERMICEKLDGIFSPG